MAEIRHIRDDEVDERLALSADAFGFSQSSPEAAQFFREHVDLQDTFGAFDEGRLVAALHYRPMEARLNDRWVPMAGVMSVGSRPEVRRGGHVGALLRAALSQMHERGYAVSMLFPTFYALYRRYGWEVGAADIAYRFDSHDLGDLRIEPRGAFERVQAEDWPTLNEVYEEATRLRNGALRRDGRWWSEAVFLGRDKQPRDAILWRDESGKASGYVIYSRGGHAMLFEADQSRRQLAGHELTIRELMATGSEAYLQLVRFLQGHDLARRVVWTAPADDPLLTIAPDPRRILAERRASFMFRIVDVPRALCERGAPPRLRPLGLRLAVHDSRCAWNEGTWQIEVAGRGEMSVERVTGPTDAEVDISMLAALVTGHTDVRTARILGRLSLQSEAKADDIASFFAAAAAPYCSDFF